MLLQSLYALQEENRDLRSENQEISEVNRELQRQLASLKGFAQ
jgi:hypothetical protein